MVYIILSFIAGIIIGAIITAVLYHVLSRRNEDRFANLSLDVLSRATDTLIRTASEKLSSERELSAKEMTSQKQVIESRIEGLNGEINKLTLLVSELEKSRSGQLGDLRAVIDQSSNQAKELFAVTNRLNETLSSKQNRGQWGERMAEDILAASGLRLGINYLRQNIEAVTGNRPDFTFLLPNSMKLNMDVKFPFENYSKFLEAGDKDSIVYKSAFIRDVRNHIKAVSGRDYINPEADTVDCVIMFIPNERIYGFIFECDPKLMDEAARSNVLICSPSTVISILAVIRQAADNFVIERQARQLLQAVGVFRKEWSKYAESFDKVGYHINKLSEVYSELSTTRTVKLDKAVGRLEAMQLDQVVGDKEE